MKALLIGLGSIGQRHIRLFKEIADIKILCLRSGKGQDLREFKERYEIETFDKIGQAISRNPDFAIITNPTALHVDAALPLAQANIPFFIEKPVSDRLEGMDTLYRIVQDKGLPVMVGFQLRFHPGFKKLIQLVNSGEIGRPMSLQGYTGQYLPDWRPGNDYRQSYSAKKDMGGGVILDLCHEIDIAISVLGPVNKVSCVCDRYSDLKIETEDMAEIIMDHQNKRLSHIHLNYLERGYERFTRVMGTLGTVIWDYGRGYVEIIRSDGSIERWDDPDGFERDWLFRDQLKQWLDVLSGRATPEVNLEDGINVTRVALAAKRSSNENRHIEL